MEIILEKTNKRNVTRLSNSINKIIYDLSAVALDILFSLFANIKKEDEELDTYEITINELNRRLTRKINKDSLNNALKELKGNEVYHISNPTIKFTFLEICEYKVEESILILKLNDMLKEYLLDLNREYLRLNFDTFLKLKSCYSKVLYLKFCQYKGIKELTINIEELRIFLNIPDSFNYGNIKQRIINPTLKVLKESREFEYIDFIEYKKVKSVNKIKFKIIENSNSNTKNINNNRVKLRTKKTTQLSEKQKTLDYLENWI